MVSPRPASTATTTTTTTMGPEDSNSSPLKGEGGGGIANRLPPPPCTPTHPFLLPTQSPLPPPHCSTIRSSNNHNNTRTPPPPHPSAPLALLRGQSPPHHQPQPQHGSVYPSPPHSYYYPPPPPPGASGFLLLRGSPPPPPAVVAQSHPPSHHHYHHEQFRPQYPPLPPPHYAPPHSMSSPSEARIVHAYASAVPRRLEPPPPYLYNAAHTNSHCSTSQPPPHPDGAMRPTMHLPAAAGCTCKKSRCLKLYCQCFASSITCGSKCKCDNCDNTTNSSSAATQEKEREKIDEARAAILLRNPAAFDKGLARLPQFAISPHRMLLPLPPPNYSHHSHIIANRNYLPPAIHASSPPHQQQQQQQQHPRHHHTYAVSSWSPEGRRLTDDNNNNTMPPAISPPPSRKLLQPSTSNDGTKEQAAVDLTVTPRASAQTSLPHPPRQPIHLVVPTATATGCKCRSSFCLKKNCECFQNATPCDPAICQCVSCQNGILDPSAVASPPPSSRSPSVQQHPKIPSTTNSAANGAARGILAPLHPFNAASYDTRPQPECSSSIARSTAHVQQHEDVGEIEILAAMAMTQLLHGLSSSKEPSNDTKESSFSSSPSITKVDPTSQPHGSAERKRRIPSITPSDECNQRSHDRKRFNRSTPDSDVMLTEDDDEIVHHSVSSSTSFVSVESRDPSPQAAHRPYSYIMRYPPHPPPQHQYHGPMRASPPPHPGFAPFPMAAYGHPRRFSNDFRGYPTATLMQCPPLPPPRMSPPSMFRALPTRQAFVSPPSKQILPTQLHKTLQPCQSSDKIKVTNEESPQSRCLPKSLSFRKICSRCGKTRGEHGEMGYGNKCIYSDCGKCGASLHCHEQAGQQMGVSCQLTVAQGATPGASAAYDRKIRSLAFRADIQQALHRRKTIPSV